MSQALKLVNNKAKKVSKKALNKAYDRFSTIFSMANKEERAVIINGLKDAGLWNENDNRARSVEMKAIAEAASPQLTKMLDIMQKRGIETPWEWTC